MKINLLSWRWHLSGPDVWSYSVTVAAQGSAVMCVVTPELNGSRFTASWETLLSSHFLWSSGVRSCNTVVSSMKKHLPLKVYIAVGAFV